MAHFFSCSSECLENVQGTLHQKFEKEWIEEWFSVFKDRKGSTTLHFISSNVNLTW